MLAFINFLRSNLLFNEAVGCGPAWWNLVFSAETTHLVLGWFGGKSSDALLDKKYWLLSSSSPCERTFLVVKWMHGLERNDGCNPLLFHPFLPFLWIRNLLYHLHTASLRLVKILCGQSGRLPVGFDVCRWWRICCSCNDWWVISTWKVLVLWPLL